MDRIQRINSLIREIVNEIISREMNDPRLDMVSISEAKTTRDIKYCKVYVSVLAPPAQEEERAKAAMEAINGAKGFIKRELATRMATRVVPELTFIYDEAARRGVAMSSLLNSVLARPGDDSDDS
jgi:ribosome-binding factor A